MTTPIIECVPNFSDARRPEVIESIQSAIAAVDGVYVLDRHMDSDHNRTVITFVGSPAGVEEAAYQAIAIAAELIDLNLSPVLTQAIRGALAAGLLCGLGLLIKRIALSYMRFISCPDDYLSNLLVNLLLSAALLTTYSPVMQPVFFWSAIALSLYIPLGKIRHCMFFFYTRILFGAFFGRRGVLPNRPDWS